MLHEEMTEKIIKAYYKVYNTLGYGFLEKVYENALAIELRKAGFKVEQQKNVKVYYEGEVVGDYYADILVDAAIIIELKSVDKLVDDHKAQLINYLKATEIEVGILLNFGRTTDFKRAIFSNSAKKDSLKNNIISDPRRSAQSA
jgi:GxxExxY protein